MLTLADKLTRIQPSATLSFTERARALARKGHDVISLSAGEPDFDTPDHIIRATKEALDRGMTRYTPALGIPELRQAVADESANLRGVPCKMEQTIVGTGAKHILYQFFSAVLNPEDEVIIPSPYWVSYPDQVSLAGGVPVVAPGNLAKGGMLEPKDLERVLTAKSKVLVINTPCNPTGTVYPKEELRALVARAMDAGLYVISDEVYKDLIYGSLRHTSPLSVVAESLRSKVFVVDGVSKSYAMTGFRIGFGIGHPDLIEALGKIQGQSTSNPSTPAQFAALAAITGPKSFLVEWKDEYRSRRDLIVEALNEIPGVKCPKPEGAFYVLPRVDDVYRHTRAVKDDYGLTTYLLENAMVAGVPGTPFGAPGHIRFSYAISIDLIARGVERIAEAIKNI